MGLVNNTVTPGTISPLENGNDRFGRNSNISGASGYCDQLSMTANTPRDWTVPSGAAWVSIVAEGGNQYWTKANGSGALPTGDQTTGLAWDYMFGSYYLIGVTTIRVVTSADCVVHFTCYSQT